MRTHYLEFLHIHGDRSCHQTHSHTFSPPPHIHTHIHTLTHVRTTNSHAHIATVLSLSLSHTHTRKHTCTQMGWRESSQCWLINSGGRLKPLTQWAAMSCLWFPDKPHTLDRSITDLNVQLLNRLPVCLLTHITGSFMHTHTQIYTYKILTYTTILYTPRLHLFTEWCCCNLNTFSTFLAQTKILANTHP